MRQPPPRWLAAWRKFMMNIRNMFKNFLRHMMMMINLKALPRGCVAGHSSRSASNSKSQDLPTPDHQKVRERPRQIRRMPDMQHQVEMEPRKLGSTWAKRTLCALAALATAVFGNDQPTSQFSYEVNEAQGSTKAFDSTTQLAIR